MVWQSGTSRKWSCSNSFDRRGFWVIDSLCDVLRPELYTNCGCKILLIKKINIFIMFEQYFVTLLCPVFWTFHFQRQVNREEQRLYRWVKTNKERTWENISIFLAIKYTDDQMTYPDLNFLLWWNKKRMETRTIGSTMYLRETERGLLTELVCVIERPVKIRNLFITSGQVKFWT